MIKVIDSKEIPYKKITDYINPRYLLRLISMTNEGIVNRNGSREILASLCESKLSPEELLESMGLTKISDSRVFALNDWVNGIGTTTALTGLSEYFFGKWTLYFLPKLPIGKPLAFKFPS